MMIPLHDIFSVGMGFYVGYNEAKGNPVDKYLLLSLPTCMGAVLSPISLIGSNKLSKN